MRPTRVISNGRDPDVDHPHAPVLAQIVRVFFEVQVLNDLDPDPPARLQQLTSTTNVDTSAPHAARPRVM